MPNINIAYKSITYNQANLSPRKIRTPDHRSMQVDYHFRYGRCDSGLMVSTLNSGSRDLGSSPGRGHRILFLSKTLYSHTTSVHPGDSYAANLTQALEQTTQRLFTTAAGMRSNVPKVDGCLIVALLDCCLMLLFMF